MHQKSLLTTENWDVILSIEFFLEVNMYQTVNAYYNGTNIVLDEDVSLRQGQKVMVTILSPEQKTRRAVDWDSYVVKSDRGQNVEKYMKEMRADDRV